MSKLSYKVFPSLIIIISFILAYYFYPQMPEYMATHWGADGKVNGYMDKFLGLYLIPIISFILYFLFSYLPATDPYKKNFEEFKSHYYLFVDIVYIFLMYLYLLTITWNLGYRFNMIQVLSPGFAMLFIFAGFLMGKAKQNWFVGIRTPWTLSSKLVWDKTHKLGAILYSYSGLLCLLALFIPQNALFLILLPIIGVSFYLFIYSYYLYRQKQLK
jgi:uncharacterized membrane protein